MRACGLPQLFMSVRLPQRTPKSPHYEESAWIKMGKGLAAICLLHTLLQDAGVILLEFGKIRYYTTHSHVALYCHTVVKPMSIQSHPVLSSQINIFEPLGSIPFLSMLSLAMSTLWRRQGGAPPPKKSD